MLLKPYARLALVLALSAAPTLASAQIEGSCLGYYDRPDALGSFNAETGEIIRNGIIPVMVGATPLRDGPGADATVIGELVFNERINPIAQDGDYIHVRRDTRPDSPMLGWVAADDVSCRATPLMTEENISRKFYIRTAANAAEDAQVGVVPVTDPGGDDCAELNGICQSMTRFQRFFIFAEDPETNSVLLMSSNLSEALEPLNGWVSADDGYRWNTRLGLRPSDNMVVNADTGSLEVEKETIMCVYETEDAARASLSTADAETGNACDVQVLGGPRWFTSNVRLPIIGDLEIDGEDFYEIAVPVATVGEDGRDALLEQVAGLDNAIRELQQLKNLDVFFLIDGTQSMEPHIEALIGSDTVKGVIPAIQDSFEGDPRFSNVTVRYGFRVYRDTYAGNFGIGEGLPLDRNCTPDEAALTQNRETFNTMLQEIDTGFGSGNEPDPDHEEALIVALAQASDDITACEDNVKMLFVIGDTGYDSESLISRGVPDMLTDELAVVDMLVNGVSSKTVDPIIPFFIHVPEAAKALQATGDRLERYLSAYQKYEVQAKLMIGTIGSIYQDSQQIPVSLDLEQNYFSMNGQDSDAAQRELIRIITDQVARFGDQGPVTEIIAGLQTGEALVEIITALQSSANGVPALRLAQIERRVCDTLGDACTQKIVSDTTRGYVRAGEDTQVDVLVSAEEFDDWGLMLRPLRDVTDMSVPQQSQMILTSLVKGLERSLGELSPAELDMPLSDFLNLKAALPAGSETPLMNYSLRDFIFAAEGGGSADEAIDSCEIYFVIRWLAVRRDFFREIDRGNVPTFTSAEIPTDRCDMRYDGVTDLTFDDFKSFPEDTMQYSYVDLNARWFWIPNQFLP
ncbi:SH3 domain-containing protein [Loktanella sp. TSTF-M6]|uniref:SH3 domain-containing protein n=1 Tax=Loktanella gaetbuli TaxID=2881335 RepID=A0ABS8BYD6_9RHOB|nr:SH3 domain-containing protein [Loktanella gaetbuli]MCB5200594.1 SH3 domain-containing protein [Loktanella gaetbuli]